MALDKARSTILIVVLVCAFLANPNMGHLTIGRRLESTRRGLINSQLRKTENTLDQNSYWKTKMEKVRELMEKKYQ